MASEATRVAMSVTYPDPVRVPLVGWLVGETIAMHASTVMRQEFG